MLFLAAAAVALAGSTAAAGTAATGARAVTSGGPAGLLQLDVAPGGGSFRVSLDGAAWLESAPTFLRAGNASHDSGPSSTLKLEKFSGPTARADGALGPYQQYSWTWVAGDVTMETGAKVYSRHPSILWTTHLPGGAAEYGFGDEIDLTMKGGSHKPTWGTPGTGWPALTAEEGLLGDGGLEYVTFLGDGDVQFGAGLGSAKGVESGAAVGYFNSSGATIVISSASSFLSSVMSNSLAPPGVLRCGIQGAALSLPPGYGTSFMMTAGTAGVPETFMAWGDLLLRLYDKPRPAANASVSLQYLGYSTTAAYFYAHRKNETYEQTMLAVKRYAEELSLPYKWMLIDSWWYHEGAVPGPQDSGVCFGGFGGVSWQWDSNPIPPASNCSGNFPTGEPLSREETASCCQPPHKV